MLAIKVVKMMTEVSTLPNLVKEITLVVFPLKLTVSSVVVKWSVIGSWC